MVHAWPATEAGRRVSAPRPPCFCRGSRASRQRAPGRSKQIRVEQQAVRSENLVVRPNSHLNPRRVTYACTSTRLSSHADGAGGARPRGSSEAFGRRLRSAGLTVRVTVVQDKDRLAAASMASDAPVGGFSFDLCKRNAFLESQMGNGAMVSCDRWLGSGRGALCVSVCVSVCVCVWRGGGGRERPPAGALLAASVSSCFLLRGDEEGWSQGFNIKSAKKTGTTISGIIFKDGVVLGADTRATSGPIVADKNCEKIHYLAPNIFCCGAGTSADCENVTEMMSSNLTLHRLSTGTACLGLGFRHDEAAGDGLVCSAWGTRWLT